MVCGTASPSHCLSSFLFLMKICGNTSAADPLRVDTRSGRVAPSISVIRVPLGTLVGEPLAQVRPAGHDSLLRWLSSASVCLLASSSVIGGDCDSAGDGHYTLSFVSTVSAYFLGSSSENPV